MAQSREEKLAKKKEYYLATREKQAQRYQHNKELAQAAGLDVNAMT